MSLWFFAVYTQPEVGPEAYNQGAEQLTAFFHDILRQYDQATQTPIGREIIQCCLDRGSLLEDYKSLIAFEHREKSHTVNP